jgi:hypothetical protein
MMLKFVIACLLIKCRHYKCSIINLKFSLLTFYTFYLLGPFIILPLVIYLFLLILLSEISLIIWLFSLFCWYLLLSKLFCNIKLIFQILFSKICYNEVYQATWMDKSKIFRAVANNFKNISYWVIVKLASYSI